MLTNKKQKNNPVRNGQEIVYRGRNSNVYKKKKKKKKKLNAVDDQRDANGNHQAVLLPIDWQKCKWLITPRDCEDEEKPEKLGLMEIYTGIVSLEII